MEETRKDNRKDDTPVVNQIIIKAPLRKVSDVGTWRAALRAADAGRPASLYNLFEDIMIDGLLSDAVQKRIDAVTNSELTFQDASGEEVPEISELMDSTAWETILTEIVKCKMYGRAGVELTFGPDGMSAFAIPAKHIDLRTRSILVRENDLSGIPYEPDPQLIILGQDLDWGLLLKATPYAIYKRGGFGDWSQWVELFGMPRRVGKYNAYDPESRKLLEEAFDKAGSAPWMVVPKETEIETEESSAGNGGSYDQFRKACNEEILITILGQTLTTIQGDKGARSLGVVHKEVEEGKNKSDLRFVQRVLNSRLLPLLESRGYPVAGGKFIFPKAVEQLSVSDVVSLSRIMDIPQSYLHEKYSIPVPQDGEPVAGERSGEPVEGVLLDSGDADIKNADRSLFARLRDFFVKAPQDGASDGRAHIRMTDGDTMQERLINAVYGGQNYWDTELFRFVSKDLLSAVQTAFKQVLANIDMTYMASDDAFSLALEQNIFHFSAAKTLAELQALNDALRRSRSYEEFAKEAEGICDTFNRRWQKTEYETAVLTAEAASDYRRLIRKTALFPYWKYVTAGDERVREAHRALDGIILPASDRRWDRIFPPNGWKCRCHVSPMLRHEVTEKMLEESRQRVDGYFRTYDWKMAEQSGWGINRGKRAVVFDEDQMYIRKFPGMAAKYMNRVKPSDWGLEPSLKKLTGKGRPDLVPYSGTADAWWDGHSVIVEGETVLQVKDRAGRTWYMKKSDYDIHTSDIKKKRAFRKDLLGCIDEVLSDPDEVWLSNEHKDRDNPESRLNNWISIRYYNGKAIACVCKLEGDRMVFKSWYELKDPKARSGILVFRK